MGHDVEFNDGQIREYFANILVEIMLTWADKDGVSTAAFDTIMYLKKKESAFVMKNKCVMSSSSQ